MPSQGPNSCGTGANVTGVGTIAWSNPTNIYTNNSVSATVGGVVATSNYLRASNFGFSIPSGATIDGIVVEIRDTISDPNVTDNILRLVKGGVISGDNKSAGLIWPGGAYSYRSFGGSSDLWGVTLNSTDVNSTDFGFVLSVTITFGGKGNGIGAVDHIRMTVHYTTGSGPTAASSLLLAGD